jgi:DNA polymerase-3 subunit epsilon
MFKHLVLHKPLAILDLETTGIDVQTASIVEIAIVKITPDLEREERCHRVNPGVPIPPAATAVHGITDADVANEPQFAALAADLRMFLDACDLCGFNLKRFDLRVLYAEFKRADLPLCLDGRAILDPMEMFHRREPRDLTAAVKFYCGREHRDAHSALADALAAAEILDAMLDRYADLPRSVADLHRHFKDPNAVDSENKFVQVEGQVQFNFGKKRGQPVDKVAQIDPGYLEWMLAQSFAEDTLTIVRNALHKVRARPTVLR